MDNDISFVYEKLARFAFRCQRLGDPWKIATQDKHVAFCDVNRNEEAKQMLQRVIIALILSAKTQPDIDKLLLLEKEINNCQTQQDFNRIIMDAYKITERNSS